MRYQVTFDHGNALWAVVDSFRPGLVLAHDSDLENAKDLAWAEEERWLKVHPATPRPGRAAFAIS